MLLEKKEPSENNDGTASIMLGKNKPKNVKWSPENELIMVEWCDIAQCYKWLHLKCHRKLSNRHAWFTIPAIALSTISGTASFAQSSLPPEMQVYAPMAIGTINILIGISTTIQQYLKISELNEAHRVSGISWDKFARNIRIELAKKRGAYKGRKATLSDDQIVQLKEQVVLGNNKSELAKEFGISRETLYKYLRVGV